MAMWLAVILGPVIVALGGSEYLQSSKLKSEGLKAPGTVVESSTLATGKGRTSYYRPAFDYQPPDVRAT